MAFAGGVVGLLNTPAGRRLVGKAKALAADPRTKDKVAGLISQVRRTHTPAASTSRTTPSNAPGSLNTTDRNSSGVN